MILFLYLIAIIWMAVGVCHILYTDASREMLGKIVNQFDRKTLSAISAVTGIVLIIATLGSRYSLLIMLIGILGVAKAFFIYFNPNNQFQNMVEWLIKTATDQSLRIFGIMAIVMGTALLTWLL